MRFLSALFRGRRAEEPAATPCHTCGRAAEAVCVACDRGACGDGAHVYSLFCTKRYGTDADQVGSKFFYVCPRCEGPACVDDLGLRGGYPCPPEQVEAHPFACPRCGGRITVGRADHAHSWDAGAELLRWLAELRSGAPPTTAPYAGHDRWLQVAPGTMAQVPFGPRPRPMRPGEAWETRVHLRAANASATLVIEHVEHPAPATALFVELPAGRAPLAVPVSGGHVWGSEALGPLLGEVFAARHATLSFDADGVYATNVDGAMAVAVERVGIRPASEEIERLPPVPPSAEERAGETDADEDARREAIAARLREVTELGIWDYTWLEHPRPGGLGAEAVVALSGSTDLSYYELVRLLFRGVRYSTVPRYFHHPEFALASPAEESQLRALVEFGPRSVGIRVRRDFGGSLEDASYLVADDVEVVSPAAGETTVTAPYPGAVPANVQWWWGEEG